jgi:hypothetical protein
MNQQPSKLMPAIWGGVLIGVISGVPLLNFINCACCAGIIGGGVLAVYLFRNHVDPAKPLNMADGAALGILAGIFGAIIGSVLDGLFGTFTFDYLYKISEYMDNPEFNDMIDRLNPKVIGPGLFFVGFVFKLVFNCVFGLVGGLLGVSFFGKAKAAPAEED